MTEDSGGASRPSETCLPDGRMTSKLPGADGTGLERACQARTSVEDRPDDRLDPFLPTARRGTQQPQRPGRTAGPHRPSGTLPRVNQQRPSVVVVMPAYNAALTLERTYAD
ncbi:MAG: hypothetical protein ACTS8Z_05845, partial [Candidatus Limnocylindrales bacterium]